ncbi:MAG: hypothetical protein NT120_02840 [Candidatus Aenigmarchaeota archaeon]|nr:hypothetical protein [Candidatus Aenigmarchaeota archaeon]
MPKASEKCTCNWGYIIVAWILGAIGIWALVAGFATQFTSGYPTAVNTTVLVWYFVGLLLVTLAKMLKCKSFGACTAHGMK